MSNVNVHHNQIVSNTKRDDNFFDLTKQEDNFATKKQRQIADIQKQMKQKQCKNK